MSKARLTLVSVISIFLVTALVLPGLAPAHPNRKHHKKHQTKHQTKSCLTTGCIWVWMTSDQLGGNFGSANYKVFRLRGGIEYVCSDGYHNRNWNTLLQQTNVDAAGNFSITNTQGYLTLQFSGKITGKTASGTYTVTSGPPYNCQGDQHWTAQGNYPGEG